MATENRGSFRIIIDALVSVVQLFFNLFRKPSRPSTPIRSRFGQDVLRAEDLLALQFEFVNLELQTRTDAEGNRSARLVASADAFIIVKFPPQSIAEEAFFEKDESYPVKPPDDFVQVPNSPKPRKDSDEDSDKGTFAPAPLPPPPVHSLLSQPSRLVFKVPQAIEPIPYDLESLLELCARSELSVTETARAREAPPVDRFTSTIVGTAVALQSGWSASAQARLSGAERLIAQARDKMRVQVSQPGRAAVQDMARVRPGMTFSPRLKPPTELETAIEFPFRLIISPNRQTRWAHASHTVESPLTKRVELWHTRLASLIGGQTDELDEWFRTVRAVWTRDPDFDPDDPAIVPGAESSPFRMSLEPLDRLNIVHLTSNYHLWRPMLKDKPQERYVPTPVEVRRLMLSTLGAWLDSRGAWLPPGGSGLGVEEWRHIATMGRDHYVRVVYKGYLFPFMHRASLVKITERKFHKEAQGNTAYLRQRMFIIVREPERFYPPTGLKTPPPPAIDGKSYDLQWPVKRIRITTLVTPNLNPPEDSDYTIDLDAGGPKPPIDSRQTMFWPRVGNSDFPFHLIVEDHDGQQVEFNIPLLFVSVLGNIASNESIMTMVRDDYEKSSANEQRRRRSMSGKHLMFAPSAKPGDTSYETQFVTFGAEIPAGKQLDALGEDAPRFYPVVRSAEVVNPSTRALVGHNQAMKIRYTDTYLKEGFTAKNSGEVFAELTPDSPAIGLSFDGKGDRSGGLVMPNMNIKGLSRLLGPVAGDSLSDITAGTFKPEQFFKGMGAKIFGVIDLWSVIEDVPGLAGKIDRVPKFITEAFTAVEAFLQELGNLKQRLDRVKAELIAKGGAVGALPAKLQTDYDNLKNQVQVIINNPSTDLSTWKSAFIALLGAFNNDLQELKTALPLLSASVANEARDLQRIIDNFGDELQNAAKVAGYAEQFLGALNVPEELKVRFEWKPELKSWPAGKAHPLFVASNNGTKASLNINAEVSAKTNLASAPKTNINCLLQNFTLDLIGTVESFIVLRFGKIEIRSATGMKPDVDVVLDEIRFVGVLSFVEVLKTLIPLDGFSDPPALNVTTEGIDASFSMALPNIAFGVFSLQNLSLGAGFNVPFVGKPLSVRFNFCERQSPFLLTVSLFGGGGFFGITIDPAGVQILEASFEFGASISVDFGVASGGVYVMAGIYFRIQVTDTGEDKASLTGYLRMGGQVKALGFISVSIELNLSLTYEFSSGKCVGRATLTIEVEVAFFSVSVEISCERKFAGSNGDPTFAQLMEPYVDPLTHEPVEPWRDYCEAFADL
jgi:hypothetical protein